MEKETIQKATLAGGCFWCTEAVFKRLKGIISVTPGYAGGTIPHPTYEQIHSGATGYAEAIQIEFDQSNIPYEKILEVFWHTHNPTTRNKQGADVGTEYRSVIFYHTDAQKNIAEKSKQEFANSGTYTDAIVTDIVPFTSFYPAEKEQKDFYDTHRTVPYCTYVIDPKIQKLMSEFGTDVKEEYKA